MKQQKFFNFLFLLKKLSFFSKKASLLIILAFIIYKFFSEGVYALIAFILSFVISFLMTNFFYNNFKYSDYFIERFFLKIIIFIFTAILFSIFSYYFCSYFFNFSSFFINTVECSGDYNNITDNNDNNIGNKGKDLIKIRTEIDIDNNEEEYYNFKLNKKLVHDTLHIVKEFGQFFLCKIAPNLGVGTAVGYAVSAMIKQTYVLSPMKRAFAISGTAFITAFFTKLGIELASEAFKNNKFKFNIDFTKFKHADPNVGNIPSPDDLFYIFSPLESEGWIIFDVLEVFLTSIFTLNVFILFLVLSILFLIFNIYILRSNLEFFNSLFEKYMPIKFNDIFKKWVNRSNNYNSRFIFIMFIVNTIVLILFY